MKVVLEFQRVFEGVTFSSELRRSWPSAVTDFYVRTDYITKPAAGKSLVRGDDTQLCKFLFKETVFSSTDQI